MEERLIIAGFGGQGVMAIGQLLTYAGMGENKKVSWLPSYGPEMRGGTANCSVIISTDPVGSPVVIDSTSAIVMTRPAFAKFEPLVRKGGNLLVNSSLIDAKSDRQDINVFYIPANDIANSLGNPKIANMVMLGAYLEASKVVSVDTVLGDAFKEVFGSNKAHFLPINKEAMEKGAEAVREQAKVLA